VRAAVVAIGNEPTVAVGDVVTIFDAQDGSRPQDLAAASKASVYDLAMHLYAYLRRKIL
jgi:alanine racemase